MSEHLKWEKAHTFGFVDRIKKIQSLLEQAMPELVAEEQKRLKLLETIAIKMKENRDKGED